MAIPGFNWTFFNVAADDVPRVLTPAEEAARKLQQEQDDYAVALRIQNGFDEGDVALAERLYEEEVQDLIEASKTPIGADEVESGDANAAHYVEPPRLCVACSDDPGVATLPCGHPYCADCLTGVLRNSMTDGTAFPPRCCRQDIEIEEVRRHLEPAFAVEFDAKAIELSTANPVVNAGESSAISAAIAGRLVRAPSGRRSDSYVVPRSSLTVARHDQLYRILTDRCLKPERPRYTQSLFAESLHSASQVLANACQQPLRFRHPSTARSASKMLPSSYKRI
ncbi:hypothetical protein TI39_contig613g00036 [Zymoseptoria brevis]|uniref:RING-type domain-containing protein n=1 Tax=Zymoseptoria brevis TaxID=1047168 RepID=A0A0F4GGM6_9PEZI|nr:hypothetical protein TI39_contig613g00036 [Zymoseptoria brevis]